MSYFVYRNRNKTRCSYGIRRRVVPTFSCLTITINRRPYRIRVFPFMTTLFICSQYEVLPFSELGLGNQFRCNNIIF